MAHIPIVVVLYLYLVCDFSLDWISRTWITNKISKGIKTKNKFLSFILYAKRIPFPFSNDSGLPGYTLVHHYSSKPLSLATVIDCIIRLLSLIISEAIVTVSIASL